jgi:hypothetical protein
MSVERTCGRLLRLIHKIRRCVITSLTSILRTFGLSSAGSVNPDATIMPEHPKVFVEQDVLFIPYFQSLDFGNLKGLQT